MEGTQATRSCSQLRRRWFVPLLLGALAYSAFIFMPSPTLWIYEKVKSSPTGGGAWWIVFDSSMTVESALVVYGAIIVYTWIRYRRLSPPPLSCPRCDYLLVGLKARDKCPHCGANHIIAGAENRVCAKQPGEGGCG